MHELSERELFEAIHHAKSIDEETGAKIIQQFQVKQAALSEHPDLSAYVSALVKTVRDENNWLSRCVI